MSFNPTIKEFLKENPDKTLLGLYWAMFWRFYVVVWGIIAALAFISYLFQ